MATNRKSPTGPIRKPRSVAILIANAHYAYETDLECCLEDLAAMRALVAAAGRHGKVHAISDADANSMRDTIRKALPPGVPTDEILFYFSGHGASIGDEFYFAGTTFDAGSPNTTGLSQGDLHDMLRAAEPNLLVKVIDACASGTQLIKAERQPPPLPKGFRNVVQLASCLEGQNSFGGEPLSAFTQALCEAALHRTEGPVYYNDVINALRDDFLDDERQTPFFIAQGTARELLVDDAARLAPFRALFADRWMAGDVEPDGDGDGEGDDVADADQPVADRSLSELLAEAEARVAGPAEAKQAIDRLFDGMAGRLSEDDFDEMFEIKKAEHSYYAEGTIREFMIRCLSREPRPDNFVIADVTRKQRKPTALERAMGYAMMAMDTEWVDHFTLELNCKLERAQLRIDLVPKFRALERLTLVLSIAPSLERLYAFAMVTRHPRSDWNSFDDEGTEIFRKWYRLGWNEESAFIVDAATEALEAAVQEHLETVTKRLERE
ncbi:MAG: caspase family protein [Sphingomonas adhaesiva]|uniref:caspase family protein n=1 Tax=Sphingomonas adhaesiva TaxID=28212 RepID=UPI002FF7B648